MDTGRDLIRDEYEILVKYKKLFYDVTKLKCKRALRPSEMKELYSIYLGLGYQPINTNCSYCVFSMCETLARRFYRFQEADVKEEITGIIKKNRGRKGKKNETESK